MGGHRNIEYAFWANEQSFGAAVLLIVGGIIGAIPFKGFEGTFVNFMYHWAGYYSVIVGLIVVVVEYPRGSKKKGSVLQRRFQRPVATFVSKLGPVTRNYFSRAVIYFALSIPACCLVTTLLGGFSLAVGAIIYFVSALKGEQWTCPPEPVKQSKASRYSSEAPSYPPPRKPTPTVATIS